MASEAKVFIGNLPNDLSDRELEREFRHYGRIKQTWIARNPGGFGFIVFEDSRDADDAVRGMDGRSCFGTRIRVEHSRSRDNGIRGGANGNGARRAFSPNDRCYECNEKGHYAYDCEIRKKKLANGQNSRGSRSGGGRRDADRSRRDSSTRRSRSRSSSPRRRRNVSKSRSRSLESRSRTSKSRSSSKDRRSSHRSRSRSSR